MDIRLLLSNSHDDPLHHSETAAARSRRPNLPSSPYSYSHAHPQVGTLSSARSSASTVPDQAPYMPPPTSTQPATPPSPPHMMMNTAKSSTHRHGNSSHGPGASSRRPVPDLHDRDHRKHQTLTTSTANHPGSGSGLVPGSASGFGPGTGSRVVESCNSNGPHDLSDPAPYACDECGARFRWRHGLRRHKLVVEQGARDFKCPHCDKRFGEKGNLNKHVRHTHLRVKAFSCSICHANFAKRDHYKRHVATIHKNVARDLLLNANGGSDSDGPSGALPNSERPSARPVRSQHLAEGGPGRALLNGSNGLHGSAVSSSNHDP